MAFNEMEAVISFPDFQVTKRIISEGKESFEAAPNSSLLFNYSAFFPSHATVPKISSHSPFDLRFGRGFKFSELESILVHCKVGERASLFFPEMTAATVKFISMQRTLLNRSGCACCHDEWAGLEGSSFRLDIEIIAFRSAGTFERDPWELTEEERKERILLLKEQGNDQFKAKEFKASLISYEKALDILSLMSLDDTDLSNLKISLQSNRAACLIQLKEFDRCKNACKEIIENDKNNAKAWYRLVQAYFGTGDLEQAVSAIDRLETFGLLAEVSGFRRQLKIEEEKRDKAQSVFARKLFK